MILLAVFGCCLVVAGVAMLSVPAAFVVAGVLCIAAAYLVAEEVT